MRLNDAKQTRMYRIHLSVLAVYYLGSIATLIYVLMCDPQIYLVLMALASCVLPAVPKLIYKALHLHPVYLVDIIFHVFAFIAIPFASILGGYNMIPHLDKILHCASGFLFAVAGMLVFYYAKPGRRKEPADAPLVSMFAAMFALSSAVLWEIYEYILSWFGADPQLVATTGIHDTMQDMMVCAIGGFITAFLCFRYIKGGRKGLMMSLFETFYEENIAPKD